jgi:phage-related protein
VPYPAIQRNSRSRRFSRHRPLGEEPGVHPAKVGSKATPHARSEDPHGPLLLHSDVAILTMELRFYLTLAGNSPVERYLERLEVWDRALLLDTLEQVAQRGLEQVATRRIEGKLREMKVSRHRVFYVTIEGPTVVVLHAYKKQSQKAPRSEVELALARMKEVLDA